MYIPTIFRPLLSLLILTAGAGPAVAQENQTGAIPRDTLIAAARDFMAATAACALITLDRTGQPHARVMDPFPPDADMVVWLATNPLSRKVREIRNDPRVTLIYIDTEGGGYVTLTGTAELVDEPGEKASRWKEGWESFYVDRDESYLLIKVTPGQLDILSFGHGITSNLPSWRTPSLEF